MKKKLLSLVLIAMLAMSVVACGAAEEDQVLTPATTEAPAESEATVNTDGTAEAPVETEAPTEAPAETTGTFTFDVPEGFIDDGNGNYAHSDEMIFANINTYTVENDGSFGIINDELLLMAMEEGLSAAFGEDVNLEMVSYEEITIGAYEAIEYAITYEYEGITLEQTQYIINEPDVFRYVTYTNGKGDGYAEIFAASGDSIRYE